MICGGEGHLKTKIRNATQLWLGTYLCLKSRKDAIKRQMTSKCLSFYHIVNSSVLLCLRIKPLHIYSCRFSVLKWA